VAADWVVVKDSESEHTHCVNMEKIISTNPADPNSGSNLIHIWYDIGNRAPTFDETDGTQMQIFSTFSAAVQAIFTGKPAGHSRSTDETFPYIVFEDKNSHSLYHVLPLHNIIVVLPANNMTSTMIHMWYGNGPSTSPSFFETDMTMIKYAATYSQAVAFMLNMQKK